VNQSKSTAVVFAVQCPNPKCRKFMLVEEIDRDNAVTCLLCKTVFRMAEGGPTKYLQTETPSRKQEA
jgi:hypothetical protein